MNKVKIPEDWTVDTWYGFNRHYFSIDGCDAWIVEPAFPVEDGRWTWCAQWCDSYVERVGTIAYLNHGFYHGFVDVFQYRGNLRGIEIMSHFQDKMQKIGLASQVSLLGLSWGGFFSLRYAEQYPERIRSLYLDAPVCNSGDPNGIEIRKEMSKQWGLSLEELASSPLNPIHGVKKLTDAKIPVYVLLGDADNIIDPKTNFALLEEQFRANGAEIIRLKESPNPGTGKVDPGTGYLRPGREKSLVYVMVRSAWGHHPHGLEDVRPLLNFHWNAWQ